MSEMAEKIASALPTVIIGAVGLYIAHSQFRLAREKLRADLFDRRFAIYEAFRNLVTVLPRKWESDPEAVYAALDEATTKLQGAKFLLDLPTHDYLWKIGSRASQAVVMMRHAAEVGESRGAGYMKKSISNQAMETSRFASELDNNFAPFLSLNDIGGGFRFHRLITDVSRRGVQLHKALLNTAKASTARIKSTISRSYSGRDRQSKKQN